MIIEGKYTNAEVMIDDIEDECISQIMTFCNHPAFTNPVAIMPDTHVGKGSVIGFTMPVNMEKIIPNVIGVDIGCGIRSIKIEGSIDLEDIDKKIRRVVPLGFNIHDTERMSVAGIEKLCERVDAKVTQVNRSLGTLGGGNHFIEIGKDLNSEYWLTVHSGSRNFGLKIANYYQNLAAKQREHDICNKMKKEIDDIINSVTPTMREAEIQKVRDKYGVGSPKELSWLDDADEYLEAMYLAQHYASFNRAVILSSICKECNLTSIESIESIHNYIDPADKIIRKGAIRSYKDEYMVIPFNMRDGILICKGKSNPTWNFSAPHGAGRVMSRSIAKRSINLDDFKAQMNGIYSTSVCQGTLDEAPDAYKSAQIIEDAIGPTASIVNRIKPIYNLKA